MTVLAVASPKGGVGKTTVALNLAWALAGRGWETLLVDLDPLGGLGLSLAGAGRSAGLWEVVEEGALLGRVLRWGSSAQAPALLTAGNPHPRRLESWNRRLASGEDLEPLFRALGRRFRVLVLDTPAGLDGPTAGALDLADHLLAPVQAEPLALRTLPALLEQLAARLESREIRLAGVLATMVRSREDVSLNTAQELFRLFPRDLVLETFIPWDAALLEASARGEAVARPGPDRPPVARVFDQLAAELEGRLQLDAHPPSPLSSSAASATRSSS